ncbi:NAD-dependent epimerase/dehydratase family protein [Flavobacteriaceae bacterium]|nr:NAD-dependent epimerase/dehydratase family protein [Flavobacteriaceae bacterium]
MKTVFITGANGLLGTNLTLKLLEEGYGVKALVRDKKSFIRFSHENLELIQGDLSDPKHLKHVSKECAIVVHIAANTSQNLLYLKDYEQANVQGTKNIIEMCTNNAMEQLIYIGTANTYGYGSLDALGNESKHMRYPHTQSLYAQSKAEAQKCIDTASSKINTVTLSPTFMIGANDTKPSSGKLILAVLNKKVAFYPSGGKNVVAVNDVVHGIIRAFSLKESGHKLILANENLSYKTLFKKIIEQNKQHTLLIPIPDLLLYALGFLGDILRFFKIKTNVSSTNLAVLRINNFYDNSKAMNELNMGFTPIEGAIQEAIFYFNEK